MTDRKSLDAANGKDKSKPKPTAVATSKDAKDQNGSAQKTSPKKRRKVNHACVYCRRSHMTCDLERPCTRCIKRNIGHLCHDQPRESDTKKPKTGSKPGSVDESEAGSSTSTAMGPPPFNGRQRSDSGFGNVLGQGNGLGMVPNLDMQPGALNATGNMNQCALPP
ncbi:hypothetical protein NLG97_g10899 [Lecanicillium saksenae]|uniref:Uncharacterized protein n=1 Tax=Lecanicillium saksenae TaxID=468837 RepID=A0ACC1QC36_9HYPO|nr:hypothetical protein NLG97_g10899 [Lecanicillium saksenae]